MPGHTATKLKTRADQFGAIPSIGRSRVWLGGNDFTGAVRYTPWKRVICIIAFVTTFAHSAAADVETDATVLLPIEDQIEDARAAGDPARVIALADQLLLENGQNTDALVIQGFAFLSVGDLNAAEENFRTTLHLAPEYLDATLGLAYVSLRRGDPATAARLAREVLDANAQYADAKELQAVAEGQISPAKPKTPTVGAVAPRSEVNSSTVEAETEVSRIRTVSVDAGTAWGDREEMDFVLTVAGYEWAGLQLAYGLRHTRRASGDGTQYKIEAHRFYSPYIFGGEVAASVGAENLARFRLGVFVGRKVGNNLELKFGTRWESFKSSRLVTIIPTATYNIGSAGHSISVRAPTSFTSEADGTATVVDMRIRFSLSDRLQLSLGHATGQEFEAAERREVHSVSATLIADLDDRLRVAATLASGPYTDIDQVRFNAAVRWRF